MRSRPLGVVQRQEAADVDEPVLLGAHGAAVAVARTSRARSRSTDLFGVAGLALLDEPAVLGEAAGVEEQRHAVALAHLAHRAHVGHRDRLAAARVVGDRDHHQRDARAALGEQPVELGRVEVALERVQRVRVQALVDHQVEPPRRPGARRWRAWCRSGCCSAPRRRPSGRSRTAGSRPCAPGASGSRAR